MITFRTFLFVSLLLMGIRTDVAAIERYQTTHELISTSTHVSHVMVEKSRVIGGLQEFDLIVLQDFKGQLPERIRMRLPVLGEFGNTAHLDRAGTEWVVMLAGPFSGHYPLRSSQGRMYVRTDESGEKRIEDKLTGPGAFRGQSLTVSQFAEIVRGLNK